MRDRGQRHEGERPCMGTTCNLCERIRREDYGFQVKGRSFSSRHRTRGEISDYELSLCGTTAALRVPHVEKTPNRHMFGEGHYLSDHGSRQTSSLGSQFTSLSVSKASEAHLSPLLTALPLSTAISRSPRFQHPHSHPPSGFLTAGLKIRQFGTFSKSPIRRRT